MGGDQLEGRDIDILKTPWHLRGTRGDITAYSNKCHSPLACCVAWGLSLALSTLQSAEAGAEAPSHPDETQEVKTMLKPSLGGQPPQSQGPRTEVGGGYIKEG